MFRQSHISPPGRRSMAMLAASALLSQLGCEPAVVRAVGDVDRRPGAGPGGGRGGDFAIPAPVARPPATSDRSCGLQDFTLERLPPEMVLVLDRSESMLETVPETLRSRWTEITGALREVLVQTGGSVLWGLKSYPTTRSVPSVPRRRSRSAPRAAR